MDKSKEKGFVQVLLLLLLLAGLGLGVWLVQTKTGFFSKAAPKLPDSPETSFELEAQADTSPTFADAQALKTVSVGQKFRVDIWARSDIDASNLFAAKLKFPTDLLQVSKIETRGSQSFVKNWVESHFDNTTGDISLVGGLPAPGLFTSSQSNVKGVTAGLTANVGNAGGSKAVEMGEKVHFNAGLGELAKSGQIYITKAPDGKSDFSCPAGYAGGSSGNSKGEKWCEVAKGVKNSQTPIFGGDFTPQEAGDYIVTVNAFTNDAATSTGDSATECSGSPLSSGPSGSGASAWSDCGPGSNFTLSVISTKFGVALFGPKQEGGAVTFTANLSDDAKSGQIYITKGDGRSDFPCPNWNNGHARQVSTGVYWCLLKEGAGPTLEGSYSPTAVDDYTVVANAFTSSNMTGNSPANECTGTPDGLATDDIWKGWFDCGAKARLTFSALPKPPITAPTTTTAPPVVVTTSPTGVAVTTAPGQSSGTLMAAQLMASIIFEAKQAGNASIDFTDGSQILRNSDAQPLTLTKKGLKLVVTETAPTTQPDQTAFQCTGITAEAQLGQLKGEDIYIVKAGDSVKVKANLSSLPAYVGYSTFVDGTGLLADPQAGFIRDAEDTAGDQVSGTLKVYNNTTGGDLVETLSGSATHKESHSTATCKPAKFLIKPAGQQAAVSAQSAGSADIKNLRHDGDVNSDGKFTLADMSALLSRFNQSGQSEADINGDGTVNSIDILKLRGILVQKGVLGGQ